jgi:hypothetical protein
MTEARQTALSRFQRDLAHAIQRRGKALLTSPALAGEVLTMSPLEAYFVVKELGVADAVPILLHATCEQLQAMVDFDCWQQSGEPSMADLDAWLGPFAAEGPEALCRAFFSLDPELQTLFLGQDLSIFDARSEAVPDAGKNSRQLNTPDGYFVLQSPISTDRDVDPFFLIDALYRYDLHEAYRLLTAAKWDLASEITEQAFHFREARLEDLGFPRRAEALALFSPPPSQPPLRSPRIRRPAASVTLPALYARCLGDQSLLVQALHLISDAEVLTSIEQDLVHLINAAVIAYGEGAHDITHLVDIAERVRDCLSLGLECLQNDAPSAGGAAALLNDWPLKDIFRHGHVPVARLAQDARDLWSDPIARAWLERGQDSSTPDSERLDRAFVRALVRHPPLLSGYDVGQPESARAFRSRQEVAEAEQRLETIQRRVF